MNIKGIFAAAMICAAAALSGCSTSEPAESESSSSSQTQPGSSVKPAPSSTDSRSSSSSTTSSSTSSTKPKWTRSSYTVPSFPSKSSSSKATPWTSSFPYSAPTTTPSSKPQEQLGGTDDFSVLWNFLEAHPGAVILRVDDSEDQTNPEIYEEINNRYVFMNIPYTEMTTRCSEIPSGRPVVVFGSITSATIAYFVVTDKRPDIPEVMYFYSIF